MRLDEICAKRVAAEIRAYPVSWILSLPAGLLKNVYDLLDPVNLLWAENNLNLPRNNELWLKHYKNDFFLRYNVRLDHATRDIIGNSSLADPAEEQDFRLLYLEERFHALMEDVPHMLLSMARSGASASKTAAVVRLNRQLAMATEIARQVRCLRIRLPAALWLIGVVGEGTTVVSIDASLDAAVGDVLGALLSSVTWLRIVRPSIFSPEAAKLISAFTSEGRVQQIDLPLSLKVSSPAVLLTLTAAIRPRSPSDGRSHIENDDNLAGAGTSRLVEPQSPGRVDVVSTNVVTCCPDMGRPSAVCAPSENGGRCARCLSVMTEHTATGVLPNVAALNDWKCIRKLIVDCQNRGFPDDLLTYILQLLRQQPQQLESVRISHCETGNAIKLLIQIAKLARHHASEEPRELTSSDNSSTGNANKEPIIQNLSFTDCTPSLYVDIPEPLQGECLYAIVNLDLSGSTIDTAAPLAAFLERDKALRYVDLTSCFQTPNASFQVLTALARSTVTELIFADNIISPPRVEEALAGFLSTRTSLVRLSLRRCRLRPVYVRRTLIDCLRNLHRMDYLSLADNRLGEVMELVDFVGCHLRQKGSMELLDLSSCFLSKDFLLALAAESHRAREQSTAPGSYVYNVLSVSYNRLPVQWLPDVNSAFKGTCAHYFALMPYGDLNQEHVAQM